MGAAQKLLYQWVMVGGSGNLWTSTDLPTGTMTWTSRTSSFGATPINAVASSGFRYVAVGDTGKLAVSDDGITWTQKTANLSTLNITGVGYGNGQWVVVCGGQDDYAYSTDNGESWTASTISSMVFAGTTSAPINPRYGGGYWVAGGTAGSLAYATSASGSWTRITSATTTLSATVNPDYFTAAGLWVIGADTGTTGALATATAPNGTWTARNVGTTVNTCSGLISNSTAIILTDYNGSGPSTVNFQSSTDGTSWTDRTPADTSSTGTGFVQTQLAVDDANRFLFQSGQGGLSSQTSTDNGANWSTVTQSGGGSANGLCHSAGLIPIR